MLKVTLRILIMDGALLAAPISDVLTFLLSLLLVRREFAVWRQRDWIET